LEVLTPTPMIITTKMTALRRTYRRGHDGRHHRHAARPRASPHQSVAGVDARDCTRTWVAVVLRGAQIVKAIIVCDPADNSAADRPPQRQPAVTQHQHRAIPSCADDTELVGP